MCSHANGLVYLLRWYFGSNPQFDRRGHGTNKKILRIHKEEQVKVVHVIENDRP